jgi:hypothetical protein
VTLRYVTAEAFKASVSLPSNVSDADVQVALGAAEKAVERVTQRRFWKDAAPVTRKYGTRDPCLVYIDDFASVTAVTVDGVTVTGYVLCPVNAAADAEPYTFLQSAVAVFSSVFSSINPDGIAVTGLSGWPAIPPEVPQMVTIIGSRLLKRTREAPFGIVTAGSLEGPAMRLARTDPEVGMLIDPLIRYR